MFIMSLSENSGFDDITINKDSLLYIQNETLKWPIENFQIQDSHGTHVYAISIEELNKKIINKKIKIGESLEVPLISSLNLSEDEEYYFYVGVKNEYSPDRAETSTGKIIKWTLGNDPYNYWSRNTDNKIKIYKIDRQ